MYFYVNLAWVFAFYRKIFLKNKSQYQKHICYGVFDIMASIGALFGTLRLCMCVFHTRLLKHILYVILWCFLSSFTCDCEFFLFLNLKLSRSILLHPIINRNTGEETILPSSGQYMYIMSSSGCWTLLPRRQEFVRVLATQHHGFSSLLCWSLNRKMKDTSVVRKYLKSEREK